MTSSGSGRPLRLALALGVVLGVTVLEVAGLVGFVLVIVVRAIHGDRSSALNVALVCVALLVWAGGLALAARGLMAGRRWSRSPLVVSELLLLAVSVSLVQGGVRWVGWSLLVGSAAAVTAVFTPAVAGLLGEAGP